MSSLYSFKSKLSASKANLKGVVVSYPVRLKRFAAHLKNIKSTNGLDPSVPTLLNQPIAFTVDLFFYFLDLIAFGEVYDICTGFLKYKTRSLSQEEIQLAKTIYGDSIDYKRVRIDNNPRLIPAQGLAAYVGVNTINFAKEKSDTLFIHELIHIWQYQHLGSVYIPRALRAQMTKEGYNYNGNKGLAEAKNKSILSFNYEQQGDIARDYFCIINGKPCLHERRPEESLYLRFIEEIRGKGENKVESKSS